MSTEDQIRQAIIAFFEQWGQSHDDLRASHFEMFTEDCVWENPGFPTTRGPEEAVRLMVEPARQALGLDTIRVDILRIAVSDGVVWTERIDDLLRSDGSVIVSVPIVGVMEMARDGRIRRWREYFDSRPMSEALASLP